MKKIVILLFVSIFNFALDVKGDLRVRSLETASSFSLTDNFVLSDTNNKLKTVKFNDLNLPQVSKIGTVMSVINNKLDIAPEVVDQATANQTTNGVGTPVALNVLNKELVDNYNAYSNGVFTCPVSGVYTSNYSANNVVGIWDDIANRWIARINDTNMAINTTNAIKTAKLMTAINMTEGNTYSMRFIAGVTGSTTNTVTILGNTNLVNTENSPSMLRIIRIK